MNKTLLLKELFSEFSGLPDGGLESGLVSDLHVELVEFVHSARHVQMIP